MLSPLILNNKFCYICYFSFCIGDNCDFDANFSNRKKIGFSWGFCIYNRKKVVRVSGEFLELIWMKMLILVGFDDIGCDI